MDRNKRFENFLKKAREIHGDKYDYSKAEYVESHTKICIICPEHGEFWQCPNDHLKGHGCPQCRERKEFKRIKEPDNRDFITKAKDIHGNKYDYSKVDYHGNKEKVCIICPKHGEFWQQPHNHIRGHGCPICAEELHSEKLRSKDFVARARKTHGNKYDYSKVEYKNNSEKVCIICPKHGEFWQGPYAHLRGEGCPKCGCINSKGEEEIYDYVCSLVGKENVIRGDRKILKGKEIDIYIPSLGFGIEYNGLRWHSEEMGKDKNYHIQKTEECKNQGVKLIQIFEDEYLNHKDIVLGKISHLLKMDKNLPKIMGRKCLIKNISVDETREFLKKSHIQGFAGSTVYLGSFYNDKLVGVMTFKQSGIKGEWELNRFATDNDYICCGIGGKLFKYFIRRYNPNKVKSFADRRWTIDEENNIYIQLSFKFDSYVEPDYKYFLEKDGIIRQHKFNFRKALLNKRYGLPLTMTEREMVEKLGYLRVYDCGLIKYEWTR